MSDTTLNITSDIPIFITLWNDAGSHKPDKNHIILPQLHQVGWVVLTPSAKPCVLLLHATLYLVQYLSRLKHKASLFIFRLLVSSFLDNYKRCRCCIAHAESLTCPKNIEFIMHAQNYPSSIWTIGSERVQSFSRVFKSANTLEIFQVPFTVRRWQKTYNICKIISEQGGQSPERADTELGCKWRFSRWATCPWHHFSTFPSAVSSG